MAKGKRKSALIKGVLDRIEKDLQEDRVPFFPLVDPNKINLGEIGEYLGSEEFLGSNFWLWKEMRRGK